MTGSGDAPADHPESITMSPKPINYKDDQPWPTNPSNYGPATRTKAQSSRMY